MPRAARSIPGGYAYHVLCCGQGADVVFHDASEFAAFQGLMAEASLRVGLPVAAYCLLPSQVRLVLLPRGDGVVSRWMHWLLTTHASRYRQRHGTRGPIWRGRFRAFPIETGEPLAAVIRHVERNPRCAGLVPRAEDWRWSSLCWRSAPEHAPVRLERIPQVDQPGWGAKVERGLCEAELEQIAVSIRRGRPFGSSSWVRETVLRLGLESSVRPRGRPRLEAGESLDTRDRLGTR